MNEKLDQITCPRCGEELDELESIQIGVGVYSFALDQDGEVQYEWEGFEPEDGDDYWACPRCGEIITYFEETAINFLKGINNDETKVDRCGDLP